jgi:translation initiation factor 2 gamma subunit (eIF-2gamma)
MSRKETNKKLEEIEMLLSMKEFYINLPFKKCESCSKEVEEQHECYVNKCNSCLDKEFTKK